MVWLLKTDPAVFSFGDLLNSKDRTTCWEGVRNYQARNFMRDQMKKGTKAFFYHSVEKNPAIYGIAEVVREAYPDPTALDPTSKYFDEKSKALGVPRWVMIDIKARMQFTQIVTLPQMRKIRGLEKMELLKKGSRLSVQPVSKAEWQLICKLGQPKSV
jgi:predicted RNA-binding protein with PUA-like domain